MIVIDTHVLIWWLDGSHPKLPSTARAAIEEGLKAGGVAASSISAWEIAMLVLKGRLDLSVDARDWLEAAADVEGFRFVPVDNVVAVKSVTLPGDFHADPADRIIVTLARELSAPLVTADEKIRRYPHVQTIW
ncbi:MAG: type II toxin-antitoxin system VapC family toxin [Aquamicrobium sp.]|nr:type II toxin-antitoxin system VapC family toxin [Aquamicrobium sp.]